MVEGRVERTAVIDRGHRSQKERRRVGQKSDTAPASSRDVVARNKERRELGERVATGRCRLQSRSRLRR